MKYINKTKIYFQILSKYKINVLFKKIIIILTDMLEKFLQYFINTLFVNETFWGFTVDLSTLRLF